MTRGHPQPLFALLPSISSRWKAFCQFYITSWRGQKGPRVTRYNSFLQQRARDFFQTRKHLIGLENSIIHSMDRDIGQINKKGHDALLYLKGGRGTCVQDAIALKALSASRDIIIISNSNWVFKNSPPPPCSFFYCFSGL